MNTMCVHCQVDYIFYGTTKLDERCRDFFDDVQSKFSAHKEFRRESSHMYFIVYINCSKSDEFNIFPQTRTKNGCCLLVTASSNTSCPDWRSTPSRAQR